MASAFSARLAVGSRKLSSVAVINQCIQSFVNFKNNVSAFAAIAAVRPAVRYKKLSAETDMSVSALTGADQNFALSANMVFSCLVLSKSQSVCWTFNYY